ncbi:MAG: PspC domain-containing protein [Candidatus Moduliflexus flocculans]|nr:PspC domain-containing protein [Candidatus Moduliflexus flocculans]
MAKKLYRSASQKMLGGVCGGLAEYFDVDVSIVRLFLVGLALITAVLPMTFFYIIAWIVVPQGSPPPGLGEGAPRAGGTLGGPLTYSQSSAIT